MRTSAGELTISGSWQAPRLRPFLQHCFRVTEWTERFDHAFSPETHNQFLRRFITPVDKRRADQCLANVSENCDTTASPSVRFRITELESWTEVHCARDFSTRFLAHKIGQPS